MPHKGGKRDDAYINEDQGSDSASVSESSGDESLDDLVLPNVSLAPYQGCRKLEKGS